MLKNPSQIEFRIVFNGLSAAYLEVKNPEKSLENTEALFALDKNSAKIKKTHLQNLYFIGNYYTSLAGNEEKGIIFLSRNFPAK